ncbi:MAG: DUF4476 domain-containing protein [Flavipsychrobacter sp.]
MKKILSIFFGLFITASAIAQPSDRPLLRIQLSDHSPLTVAIDGRYYKKHGTALTIGDLPQGKHHVKVYAYYPPRRNGNARAELLYESNIRTKRGTFTNCIVDAKTGYATIDIRDLSDNDFKQAPAQPDNNVDNIYGNQANAEGNNSNADYKGAVPDNALNPGDMDALKGKVSAKIADGDKLKIIKNNLKNRSYYTDQVSVMMGWLNFESTRLELAKWAYSHVIDKKNYPGLEKQFTFKSSKEEFESYINTAR